jgi:hypothetical protein
MLIKRLTTALGFTALGTTAIMTATATRAEAQVSVAATCSPGIPGCSSLRIFLEATGGGVSIDQLFIKLLSPSWAFTGDVLATVGSYSAEDDIGPFSGFTTLGSGGTTAAIDFTENGFPFELFDAGTGFFDLTAAGTGDADGLQLEVDGTTSDGGTFVATTATPEPGTIALVGTGLAMLVGVRRRRREKEGHLRIWGSSVDDEPENQPEA